MPPVQGPVAAATNRDGRPGMEMLSDQVSVTTFYAPNTTERGDSSADTTPSSTLSSGDDVHGVDTQFSDAVTIYDDEKLAILSFLNYIHDKPHDATLWRTPARRRTKASATRNVPTMSSMPRLVDQLRPHDHLNDSKRKPPHADDTHSSSLTSPKKRLKHDQSCVCNAQVLDRTPDSSNGLNSRMMIVCANKLCPDSTKSYHLSCVGLEEDTPSSWHCPSCTTLQSSSYLTIPLATGKAVPENLFRKPALSITYGDMIAMALRATSHGEGTFKQICEFIERRYETQLNWKLESDQRKSPVWKSSVRKILFSNPRFARHPNLKGVFCLVEPSPAATSSPLTA
ncbi:hypothetical protein H257_18594 [Aphanomyces astaci]|uniref:Zinc finger PHD-type domain-containing protein n=1 Tax=Aphanomyces astaci TaxID=112090 RepID=W4FC78_APHAT|nr:hypothetical protein H257_18594 [Aphanomyces astaci]ETV64524.1 hypothetical protein H257_18594 [Aphanomyces astaci]|eukprot:XP_009845989.1 hypothetical protein H257_18594 [Aphanomyces astaci]